MDRRCSRCAETKDETEFYAKSQGRLNAWCKDCYRKWHRERYQPQSEANDEPRICTVCGSSYRPKTRRPSWFCSRACKDKAREEVLQAARVCSEPGCTNRPAEPGSRLRRCSEHSGIRTRYVDSNGYVRLESKVDGVKVMILEHRKVVQDALGRMLYPFENVHHRNGIKSDNRLDNLEIWTKSQPCGQRPEDLAQWVLETYPELIDQLLAGRQPALF